MSGGEYKSRVESEIITLINDLRKELGLSLLTYDYNLKIAARIRAGEMALANVFSHTRPDGRAFHTVLTDIGVSYHIAAENLAWRDGPGGTASELFEQWENSPSHYSNMVAPDLTHVGLGVIYVANGAYYQTYACTTFATY